MCRHAAISSRGEQQPADQQGRQGAGGQRQVFKAPFFRRSANRLRSKDLLFRELRTSVSTSVKYRRDCRHLYCVVMLWAGRRSVDVLDTGSCRLHLRGIALLKIGNRRLNLSRAALLKIGNRRLNLSSVASTSRDP
jgi:hypothetical protein